jgi:hypothetical protein
MTLGSPVTSRLLALYSAADHSDPREAVVSVEAVLFLMLGIGAALTIGLIIFFIVVLRSDQRNSAGPRGVDHIAVSTDERKPPRSESSSKNAG